MLTFTTPPTATGGGGGKPAKEEPRRDRAPPCPTGELRSPPGAKDAEERQLSEAAIDYVVSRSPGGSGLTIPLYRTCGRPEGAGAGVQRLRLSQRRDAGTGERRRRAHYAGRPLDAGTRRSMEARFGHDFSRVRCTTTLGLPPRRTIFKPPPSRWARTSPSRGGRYDPAGAEGGRCWRTSSRTSCSSRAPPGGDPPRACCDNAPRPPVGTTRSSSTRRSASSTGHATTTGRRAGRAGAAGRRRSSAAGAEQQPAPGQQAAPQQEAPSRQQPAQGRRPDRRRLPRPPAAAPPPTGSTESWRDCADLRGRQGNHRAGARRRPGPARAARTAYLDAASAARAAATSTGRVNIVVVAAPKAADDHFITNATTYARLYISRVAPGDTNVQATSDSPDALFDLIETAEADRMIRRIDIFCHGTIEPTHQIKFGTTWFRIDQIEAVAAARAARAAPCRCAPVSTARPRSSCTPAASVPRATRDGMAVTHGQDFLRGVSGAVGGRRGQETVGYVQRWVPRRFEVPASARRVTSARRVPRPRVRPDLRGDVRRRHGPAASSSTRSSRTPSARGPRDPARGRSRSCGTCSTPSTTPTR